MLADAVVFLPLWVYLLASVGVMAGGVVAGAVLGFVMWLPNKGFAATVGLGLASAMLIILLLFRVSQ